MTYGYDSCVISKPLCMPSNPLDMAPIPHAGNLTHNVIFLIISIILTRWFVLHWQKELLQHLYYNDYI